MILHGEKTFEGRVAKPKYKALRMGQRIHFQSAETKDQCERSIASIATFDSFNSMLETLGIRPFLGDTAKNLEEGCAVYHAFPGYKEDEKTSGVVAIQLQA